MTNETSALNKQLVLGGQYWLVGAMAALTLGSTPLAVPLVAVGAYLVLTSGTRGSSPGASNLLLRAE